MQNLPSQDPTGIPTRPGDVRIVSVIIPCRKEVDYIEAFMQGVLAQTLPAGYEIEVLVADGMSDDGTREVLGRFERTHANVRVIDNQQRIVSAGLNMAIREARGSIIVRMDLHTEYSADYIQRCLETLEETGADNVGGPARTRPRQFVARAVSAAYHSRFSNGGATFHREDYEGYTDTVPYGCWRAATLQRLGMFDEDLVRNQDDELNLRLTRAGGRIWQSPKIVSWYHTRGTLSSLFRQYFQYGFWKIPVIKKHRLPASWRHLAPGSFALVLSLLLLVSILSWAFGASRMFALSAGALAILAGTYGMACVLASVVAARKHGWSLLPILPLVFATYHVSYGLGFLLGIWHWHFRGIRSAHDTEMFSQISR